ncbi:MAG: MotA/TolQ/ExbB proton channel family protein [Methylomicrobium sp.]
MAILPFDACFAESKSNQISAENAKVEATELLEANEPLLGAIRESAENLKPYYRQFNALIAVDDRSPNPIDRLADKNHIPDLDELSRLFAGLQKRLDEASAISVFRAMVYAPDGQMSERDVLRLGAFSFLSDGRYLVYVEEVDGLVELARQPNSKLFELASEFARTDSGTLAQVAIDPTGGQIVQLVVQTPTLRERIEQGGIVAYLILALASCASIVSIYRFVELTLIGKRIARQLQSSALHIDNPLGRVLLKLEQKVATDPDALYLTVEEALTGEQIQLERALTFLKLVAAVAPMLGLLGTVTGMIETFQAIALHGSGDPKLMSGGISQALVTTVAGLVTAIPILLIYSLLIGKCQNLGRILEAHVAAALAQRFDHGYRDENDAHARSLPRGERERKT